MEAVKIVLLCVASAALYGIAYDQVTARLCSESFSLRHPYLYASPQPTALALARYMVVTWLPGVFLGLPLALESRLGSRPKLVARDLVQPVVLLFFAVASVALLGGLAGYELAQSHYLQLARPLSEAIPQEKHVLFVAADWARNGAYLAGLIGACLIWRGAWRHRDRLAKKYVTTGRRLAR